MPLASGVVSVGLVRRQHVSNWANQLDARSGIVELVRRLVEETCEGPVRAEFATDEGIDLGEFDGLVCAKDATRWVPDSRSVWELSTRRDVGTKANEDYRNRVAAPSGWSMSETTYVAVSLRAWIKRRAWATERTAEACWRNVWALGLDDVMAWLSVAPRSEFWLAERLGLHPHEFQRGASWWKERQRSTGGLFNRAVALAGRADAAEELRQRMASNSGPVVVEAAAVEEALEFIAAVGETCDGPSDGGSLLDRMVFVSGQRAWQRLLAEDDAELVLVAMDPRFDADLRMTTHTVVIPVRAHGGDVVARHHGDGSRACVAVPCLDSRSIGEALDCAAARQRGIDFHRAQELGQLGRLSPTALRRALSTDPVIRKPRWARIDSGDSLVTRQAMAAALLAGGWDAGSSEYAATSADRQILARLAGGDFDYEVVEGALRSVATGADPMLVESRSAWRLVNPHEAWILLADTLLTADVLRRFFLLVTEVLGERDPLDDLSGEEYAVAQTRGIRRSHSRGLRRGMARTLALLCSHSSDIAFPSHPSAAARATRCVEQLLETVSENGVSTAARVRRLADLGDILPLLAEAAPEEFVTSVDRSLELTSETAHLLFTDTGDAVPSWALVSPHTELLFAVEMLAWLPDQLPSVADILLRLEILDPGGRLANRPASTFAAIFSAWAPRTGISHDERLHVLRGLRDRLVDSAAESDHLGAFVRLLARLIPQRESAVVSGPRPEVREHFPSLGSISPEDEAAYRHEVAEFLMSLIEHRVGDRDDAGGLLSAFELHGGVLAATSLPPQLRARLWALCEEAVSGFGADELSEVGRRLAGLARLHRNFAHTAWALSPDEIDRIARIAEQIAAARPIHTDPVEAHLWLFEEYHPSLGPDPQGADERAAYEQVIRERRANALGEVLRAERLSGVFRLAARIHANPRAVPVGTIGAALADLESQSDNAELSEPPNDTEIRLLAALDLPADETASSLDAQRETGIARRYFARRFQRMRSAGGDGWIWLSELLKGDDLTSTQQARLVELTRDHPRAWQVAEALGPAVRAAYWRLMDWRGFGSDFEHLEEVARGLLSVGRAAAAVELLAIYDDDSAFEPDRRFELAIEALEALAGAESAETITTVDASLIAQLLDFLAERCPLTPENLDDPLLRRLTQLEIDFLECRETREPAPFIHDRMALDPRAFVDVVRVAYSRVDDQADAHDPQPDTPENERDLRCEQRSVAWQILRSWQRPPGVGGEGAVNYEQLCAWIDVAQRMLDEQGLRENGDEHIGRVLSAAPRDPGDDIAPQIAIRRLLEHGQTPHFEDGLALGLRSGPTGQSARLVSELVAESRGSHEQATSDAAKIAARWPHTARLLRQVGKAHVQEARIWQDEQDRLD